jgi:hypothetical protein
VKFIEENRHHDRLSILVLALCAGIAGAQSATEREITQLILDGNLGRLDEAEGLAGGAPIT